MAQAMVGAQPQGISSADLVVVGRYAGIICGIVGLDGGFHK